MSTAKNIRIGLYNDTECEVKVTKIEYQDGDKWKVENCLGLDGHQKLMPHKSIDLKRQNLEGVGDEMTQIRITYKDHVGGSKWGKDKVICSSDFTAFENFGLTVHLSNGHSNTF
jgi:hypothetical protein